MDWSEVQPVLETTYRLLAQQEKAGRVTGQAVNEALGRDTNDEATGRVLKRLHEAGYIRGQFAWQTSLPLMIDSTEKGATAGLWLAVSRGCRRNRAGRATATSAGRTDR